MDHGLMSRNFLFRALEPNKQRALGALATQRSFQPGEVVFHENDPGDAMYIIRTGAVVVEKEGQELARLGSGYHFGEISLVDGFPRSATVRVLEPTELLEIKRDAFLDVMTSDREAAALVYRSFTYYLCRRLRETNDQLVVLHDQHEE